MGTQEGTPGALYCGQRGGAALVSVPSARADCDARAPARPAARADHRVAAGDVAPPVPVGLTHRSGVENLRPGDSTASGPQGRGAVRLGGRRVTIDAPSVNQRGARAPLTHRALHACHPQSLHRFGNASAAQAIELDREAAITATRPATSDLKPDETTECA
jgi:hypothetical protein